MQAFQISYFDLFFNVVKMCFFTIFSGIFCTGFKKWVLGLHMTSLKTKCILFMKM